jgi:hypothetical protein
MYGILFHLMPEHVQNLYKMVKHFLACYQLSTRGTKFVVRFQDEGSNWMCGSYAANGLFCCPSCYVCKLLWIHASVKWYLF